MKARSKKTASQTEISETLLARVWKDKSIRAKHHWMIARDSDNSYAMRSQLAVLTYLAERYKHGLSEVPVPRRVQEAVAKGKGELAYESNLTGRPLRYRPSVDFLAQGKRIAKPEEVPGMSRRSFAYFSAIMSWLDLPLAELKKEWQPHALPKNRRTTSRERASSALARLRQGLAGIPQETLRRLGITLEQLTETDCAYLGRMAEYITKGQSERVWYNTYRGETIAKLDALAKQGVLAPKAMHAAARIESDLILAPASDHIRVAAALAQCWRVPVDTVFGNERKDILYAIEHNLFPNLELGKRAKEEFIAEHWYREVKPTTRKASEIIKKSDSPMNEIFLSAAEAAGLRKHFTGFWEQKERYLDELIQTEFPSRDDKDNLYVALKEMREPYEADFALIREAKGRKKAVGLKLSKDTYDMWQKMYHAVQWPDPKLEESINANSVPNHQQVRARLSREWCLEDTQKNLREAYTSWKITRICSTLKPEERTVLRKGIIQLNRIDLTAVFDELEHDPTLGMLAREQKVSEKEILRQMYDSEILLSRINVLRNSHIGVGTQASIADRKYTSKYWLCGSDIKKIRRMLPALEACVREGMIPVELSWKTKKAPNYVPKQLARMLALSNEYTELSVEGRSALELIGIMSQLNMSNTRVYADVFEPRTKRDSTLWDYTKFVGVCKKEVGPASIEIRVKYTTQEQEATLQRAADHVGQIMSQLKIDNKEQLQRYISQYYQLKAKGATEKNARDGVLLSTCTVYSFSVARLQAATIGTDISGLWKEEPRKE